jgi:NAD(P)-dependent dehydrogenase (short-subunit alcohol dehydrogenase family)
VASEIEAFAQAAIAAHGALDILVSACAVRPTRRRTTLTAGG